MIFVDAVSGYRCIFSHVPAIREEEADADQIIAPYIMEEDVHKYAKDVRKKQIDKQYLLKKPDDEVLETSLVYLPIFKVVIESNEVDGTFYINAITGEHEKYLSERWNDGKDLME